jgi:hypothetical protein
MEDMKGILVKVKTMKVAHHFEFLHASQIGNTRLLHEVLIGVELRPSVGLGVELS